MFLYSSCYGLICDGMKGYVEFITVWVLFLQVWSSICNNEKLPAKISEHGDIAKEKSDKTRNTSSQTCFEQTLRLAKRRTQRRTVNLQVCSL